jgi:peptidoglycan hydrolase-like protein with peptidoglycan-binding domain
MRNLRPALLILLTASMAGLGVPGSFGQAKAASKAPAKKKASVTTASTKAHPATVSSSKKAPAAATPKGSAGRSAKSRPSNKRSKGIRKQPGQKAPTTDRISEIQTALARDGSFPGPATGKWDDDTAAAMRRFQASHGLNVNGKLDAPTLQRLGLGSQTAGIAAPTPPPGATSRLTSSANAPSTATESTSRQ